MRLFALSEPWIALQDITLLVNAGVMVWWLAVRRKTKQDKGDEMTTGQVYWTKHESIDRAMSADDLLRVCYRLRDTTPVCCAAIGPWTAAMADSYGETRCPILNTTLGSLRDNG